MNLSPEWVPFLRNQGFDTVHWSSVGAPNATDAEILHWARENQRAVFTHDLDFGIILAYSKATGPSVIQARTHAITPTRMGQTVAVALETYREWIENGALVTIDAAKSRVRILPI